MYKSKILLVLGLILTGLIYSCGTSKKTVTNNLTNAEKATAVLQAIQSGDVAAMQNYISPTTYTQHNLSYPNGAGAVIGATKSGTFKGTTIKTYRAFTDNDIVVLHSEYGGVWNKGKPQAVFDVFRFTNGKIVEHWDNLTDVKDDNDGTTQFNGTLTPATDLKKTEANRKLLTEMGQVIFIKGEYDKLGTYFNEKNYTQHSVGYGTDIKPLQSFLNSLPKGTPFYQKIEFIHVEGNFALMMSQGYPDKKTSVVSAYYDLFRLENGKIVEHWDVVQAIPKKSKWANSNGKW